MASAYSGPSIVDYLNSIGQDSSYESRAKLAAEQGISGYTGSADQNTLLLSNLQGGGSPSGSQNFANDPAFAGGVGGKFLDLTPEQAAAQAELDANAPSYDYPTLTQNPGESNYDFAQRIKNQPFYLPGNDIPKTTSKSTLNTSQANDLIKQYGFTGLGFTPDMFVGLTSAEANALASKKKAQLLGQAGPNTSLVFNADAISEARKVADQFKLTLTDSLSDPFDTAKDKQAKKDGALDTATDEYAALFSDPETFVKTYQTNPDFSKFLQDYLKAGGTVSDISARIKAKSASILPDEQSAVDYLSGKVYAPQAREMTDALLAPETARVSEELKYLNDIPNQYKAIYYGTAENKGIIQKQRDEATAQIEQIDKEAETATGDTEKVFSLQASRNNAEAMQAVFDTQQKKEEAKAYLLGRLAQLGALTTTGVAPDAITRMDGRYDNQINSIKNQLTSINTEMTGKKNQAIKDIQTQKAAREDKIVGDLNASEEEIQTKLLDLETKTNEKIQSVLQDFNKLSRDTYSKQLDKADKLAADYVKAFYKTVTGDLSNKYMSTLIPTLSQVKGKGGSGGTPSGKTIISGKLKTSQGEIAEGASLLERGPDTYVDPYKYLDMYKTWLTNGGLPQDFKKYYSPVDYINPTSYNLLPVGLRPSVSKARLGTDGGSSSGRSL